MIKNLLISIVIICILLAGFNYGYQKSHYLKKSTQLSSTVNTNSGLMATRDGTLEFQLIDPKTPQKGTVRIYSDVSDMVYEGVFSIDKLVSTIIDNDPASKKTKYLIETDKKLKTRQYQILLICPLESVSMKLVNQIGEKMGFKVAYSYDTEVPWYRAVRNNNPISFEISSTSDYYVLVSDETCSFHHLSMQNLLNEFTHMNNIDDETGVKDFFNGQFADNTNNKGMKNELAAKAGVELIPFQKKVKYFEVRKQ